MQHQCTNHIVIIIPARMSSTRFPGKVLSNINGVPMVIHVANIARAVNIGRVIIATDHPIIQNTVSSAGFETIMTHSNHVSGSDRIFEALNLIDLEHKTEIVVNVQADLPTIKPEVILATLMPLQDHSVDIGTVASNITHEEETNDPNVVKVIGSSINDNRLRALYFTRARAPYGIGPFYQHIGIYAYKRKALERFIKLEPSPLEKRESLEQLRALENNMRIDVELIKTQIIGVDTPADLEKVRLLLSQCDS
ncbi:3-deoxy-manno-octulosonate cytidylyltransferase [Liberibacter crescens BT-1]|uniref:3-deoxy-manno-octulosonate cytidylyltransferase n=1 Tax=Liberibacter crescens (strain BT-1) TaxID=1215343 RepID=L0ETU1_LIBCB|nr:3-deoxy-manno-octulosonate cytidylyltransferase [Liberibacter crescens]AGA64048.1 3-deoxy-manno-octulosonate cytidylyltransferase [Liberibacter crescens BT-1]AMC12351.1 3-deoxy-manno-octulosonate cytidylyltransferase [Liberibacter crescens]